MWVEGQGLPPINIAHNCKNIAAVVIRTLSTMAVKVRLAGQPPSERGFFYTIFVELVVFLHFFVLIMISFYFVDAYTSKC